MKPDNKILHNESDQIENLISKLIGRHNVLCEIEKVFTENKIANKYFENAQNKVLDSGNASLASMFVIAIKDMAKRIDDLEEYPIDY